MNEKVAIIGAGEMGQALGNLLKEQKGLEIEFWDADPEKIKGMREVNEVVVGAAFVFLCIPSVAIRTASEDIGPLVEKNAVVVSLAKGIEEESFKTMDEVMAEVLPEDVDFALFSGPMLAEEMEKGMMAGGMIASDSDDALDRLRELFKDSRMEIDTSVDVHGVALAGVLKNIFAIALGFVGGMEYGENAKGWMVTRALNEMAGVIELLGGSQESAYSSAGIGDLIATGFSGYSSNYRLGFELAQQGSSKVRSEGLISIPSVAELLEDRIRDFPILDTVRAVLIDGDHPERIYKTLISD